MTLYCPNCGREVLLSDGEWESPDIDYDDTITISGSIQCDTCEAVLDVLLYPWLSEGDDVEMHVVSLPEEVDA